MSRMPVDPEVVSSMAREFADERLNGLRGGQVWFQAFKKRGEKVARQHGMSWAELYPEIHRLSYAIIDADPRAWLTTTRD